MTEISFKQIRIDEQIVEDKRLGRHVLHDPKSFAWPYIPRSIDRPIHSVHHRHFGGVLDQGNLGSCTGNAAVQALNTKPLHRLATHTLKEEEALNLYSLATSLDPWPGEYPPDDTGSDGLSVAKACQQQGYIIEYRHAFGIDEALRALIERPVITGVNWYEGFDNPDDRGFVKKEGQIRGGHEFVVVGYNDTDKYVEAINSWGRNWGLKGRFRMSVDVWNELLQEDGDVTVLINGV